MAVLRGLDGDLRGLLAAYDQFIAGGDANAYIGVYRAFKKRYQFTDEVTYREFHRDLLEVLEVDWQNHPRKLIDPEPFISAFVRKWEDYKED